MERDRRKGDQERIAIEHRVADDVSQLSKDVAVMESQIKNIEKDVHECVTKLEFAPVKLLVYGLAATLLSGIIAALLAQVLRHS